MKKLHNYTERLKGRDGRIDLSTKVLRNSWIGENMRLKPPEAYCVPKWRPATINRDRSEQAIKLDGMTRHVKHIRARSGMLQGRMSGMADVKIEVGDDSIRSGQSVKHTNIGNVSENTAASKVRETEVPQRRSNRERAMPFKYSESYCS